MVILLSLNFPYEQSEMPFDVLPRRQDFYGSQLFGSSFIFEPLLHGFGSSSRPMNASSELRPALLFGSRCRRCPNRWIDRI